MSKSLREQITEAAGKVGAIVPITVEGIDETLYVRRLSIEERFGVSDPGLSGHRASVALAINLITLAVVNPDRSAFASRDEWAAWANDHQDAFTALAFAVKAVQGAATKEETEALGKD